MTITLTLTQPQAKVHLKARKTMAGDIMIFDHPDFNVVISPGGNKVLALAKEQYGSHIYAAQSRLFDYLSKHGVIATQVAIYSVAKFFQGEKGHYDEIAKFDAEWEKEITDPSDEDSTPLGKIPHHPRQGTNNRYPGSTAAYGLTGY